jgi:hypothetical protein
MRWLVFQKRDGSNILVIWRDTALWNKSAKTVITPSTVNVTIESDSAGTQVQGVAGDIYYVNL